MIKVFVRKQGNYPISSSKVKNDLREFLTQKGIVSDCEVSVAVVGEKKMLDLSRKFLKDKKLHDVLSFTESETKGDFVYPDSVIRLGEIIICYPAIFADAKRENRMIDEKVLELVRHGASHLLGEHHE